MMPASNSPVTPTRVARTPVTRTTILLHWLLAISIFFLFISSWWMLALPLPSDEFTYRVLPFQLHKNIGLSLLIIIVAMLVVRYSNRDPAQFLQRSLLRKLVDFDHLVIYLLISACCISGYLSSSYSGWGTSLWWLVEFPNWTEENDALNITYSEIHLWTCWLLLAVVVIHIGAAVYHGFADDGVINKMFRF